MRARVHLKFRWQIFGMLLQTLTPPPVPPSGWFLCE